MEQPLNCVAALGNWACPVIIVLAYGAIIRDYLNADTWWRVSRLPTQLGSEADVTNFVS
jgi:hypothetical protein